MSVGLEEAARREKWTCEIPLAVDLDRAIMNVYQENLPRATTLVADVSQLFDGKPGSSCTSSEMRVRKTVGAVDVLMGGPPCQGHSNLNNHTRRRDPKNDLYLVMARAAEVLAPQVVVIENVEAVLFDSSKVVDVATRILSDAGYRVDGRVMDLSRVGVPQRRRRHVLLASMLTEFIPAEVLTRVGSPPEMHSARSVRWAIADLSQVEGGCRYDTSSRTSERNLERIDYLFQRRLFDLPNSQRPDCHRYGGHTYVSMYGRLKWDEPAQTITTGFGSMGQGRYVHPARRRTITPHEAARLQTFPDWFDFGSEVPSGTLARMIGNAVPPLLMVSLGAEILRRIRVA